ncbi:unnamed protein product [Meganyctiphanes norvegica]|uniref:UDP-glucuronosyltransferase n=1 Tax=Meganyctiphanes norvegica TaxID=48144 RepID=A0AAV2PV96_MEGNR
MKLFSVTLLVATCALVESSRVLMVLPLGSRSHKNIMTPLASELGKRGHQVTVASLHEGPVNSTSLSYTDLAATQAWDTVRKVTGDYNVFKMRAQAGGGDKVNSAVMRKVLKHLPEYCDAFLRDPALQSAWVNKPDLILLPAFMNECGLALVYKFKVPFIYVTTSGLTPWTADLLGNPENPAYIPNQYLSYGSHMTLWQRTVNTLVRIVSPYLRERLVLNKLDGVVQQWLGNKSVSLSQVEKDVSLVLVNSHHSLGVGRPLMPNVVEVGAMHCRPAKPLKDQQLKNFLDKSATPVVYFSLGSSIRSEQMPDEVKATLVRAFARLPYRVVWKLEGNRLPGLTSNVLTREWLPQQDILGHKNVKAFITHGGLLSLQESVYHGVPMVGMPLMSDQHLNVRQAVTLGLALELTPETMTEDQLVQVLTDIVENPKYRDNVEERSRILVDQETSPLDRAVYWSEYVLRHKGAKHLRSEAASMPMHQYLLLDVMAVITLAIVAILITVYFIMKKITHKAMAYFKRTASHMLAITLTHVKNN